MDNLQKHYRPENMSDRVALVFTKLLRLVADIFFKKNGG